ncbi:SEC-C domain-containing protein [Marinicellulosiphila megalodicopiae]|uniref:SEC-C domain-containing protein n=1 Tax=Marinicellulosiphila megalodicopiae TaxID=2724896 RepID=UPI003BAEFD7A
MGGDIKEMYYNALSKFFLSFIIYDEVIITDSDFKILVSKIGIENCLALLDSKKLKLIYDKIDVGMEFLNSNGSRLKFTNQFTTIPFIEYIDRNYKEFSNKKSLKPKFIQYMDNALLKNIQSLDAGADNSVYDNAYKELINEVNSSDISKEFLSGVESIHDMDPFQSTKTNRLFNALKGFSFQDKCGAEVILQDAFSKEYLNSKLAFLFRGESIDKVDLFSEITKSKGIPDFYHLLQKNIIGIHDIVEFATSKKSKFFMDWFADENVSKEDVYFKLMASKKERVTSKGVRWLFPNIVGLVNPVLGVVASGVDSFIVNKIVKGWNPNIYLDEFLKSNIDILINDNEKKLKKRDIINRFGSVKPNSPCPCQSGLKFKKCHGY